MRDRLEILRDLLSEDGSIWITIDDHEAHYLKVLCDEIFGRDNFVCDVAWEKRYSPPPKAKGIGYVHDHVLVFRKSDKFERKLLPKTQAQVNRYKNLDEDPRGPWKPEDYTCRHTAAQRPNLYYAITQPKTGEEIWPDTNRVWAMSEKVHEKNEREGRIWWGLEGDSRNPKKKKFLHETMEGIVPASIWKHTLAGHNQQGKRELLALYGEGVFPTPKPEKLIRTVLQIATEPGDLVLDCFAGSGTTGAVAHKMERRWIMVEVLDHVVHIAPRLKRVIDGEDPGGVTEEEGWEGGGGFRFLRARVKKQISFSVLNYFQKSS
jgi:adenine-specific DNA-methyltransferase